VAGVIAGLRASRVVTNVVVLRHSGLLKETVDVWGEAPAAAVVQQSLKRAFDPAGILNAGRGPY
jgi:FAD/FMN-containing dehydrogenase